jgi:signal transduction histidine kinase
MNQSLTPLIISYATVLAISSAFAGYLWFTYKHELLKLTFFIWVSVIAGFFAQGFFNTLDLSGFLAYSTNITTVILLLLLSDRTTKERVLPIKWLVLTTAIGLILSLVLFSFNLSYAVSAFPFSFSCAVALIVGAFYKPTKSSLEVSYKVLLVLSAIHFLDYPFLRPNPDLAIVGFSMGLVFTFCYSILIPMFVMRIISDNYTSGLEEIVKSRTLQLNEAILKLSNVNSELAHANVELKALSAENQNLLNVLVHDLSNPINVMMGSVKNIKPKEITEDSSRWLTMLDRSLQTVRNTISHVSTFHIARFGKLTMQTDHVDLLKVMDNIKEDFKDHLSKKSLSLHVIKEDDNHVLVLAEEQRLKNQIMGNLISNAIKFSNSGDKVEITISKTAETVSILVRDYGIGVPKERVETLFESNKPTSTFGTDGEKGMGLGLPIVMYYVKAMGGDVRHVSLEEASKGSCFEVKLKCAPQSSKENPN